MKNRDSGHGYTGGLALSLVKKGCDCKLDRVVIGIYWGSNLNLPVVPSLLEPCQKR